MTVNLASLTSFVETSAASLILMIPSTVALFGTVHENAPPDAGTPVVTTDQDDPPSDENSIFTLLTVVEVHVTLVFEPWVKVSPPLGERTATAGAGKIMNAALLTSLVEAFDASLRRTRPCCVGEFGTVQEKLPAEAETPPET